MPREKYGSAKEKIAQIMYGDESLTIEQLVVLTGFSRDTIIKAVRRNRALQVRRERDKRGIFLVVENDPCSCGKFNGWTLRAVVKVD